MGPDADPAWRGRGHRPGAPTPAASGRPRGRGRGIRGSSGWRPRSSRTCTDRQLTSQSSRSPRQGDGELVGPASRHLERLGDRVGGGTGRRSLSECTAQRIAATASSSGGGGGAAPPRTTTISPRTSPSKCATAPSSVPRHTSSWSLVSSRATTTGAVGPARLEQVGQGGDQAAGRLEDAPRARVSGPAPRSVGGGPSPRRGRKPSKQNRSVGSPLTTRAASAALGPGHHGDRWRPPAAAAATSRLPGSDTRGVPASLTTATVRPRPDARARRRARAASLWSCRRQAA